MRSRSSLDGDDGRLPIYPIQVFRVDPGVTAYVRMLSPRYGGVFTHYVRGRSSYCPGEGCNPAFHRLDRYWKGYASAEVWNAGRGYWVPVCLEITEHLELDMRDVFARGQVWELSRAALVGKRKPPVSGKVIETRDPKTFPSEFDLVPVLLHLYHIPGIDLTARNPLPPRLALSPTKGEAPKLPGRAEEERVTAADLARLRASVGGAVSDNGASETRNGQRNGR